MTVRFRPLRELCRRLATSLWRGWRVLMPACMSVWPPTASLRSLHLLYSSLNVRYPLLNTRSCLSRRRRLFEMTVGGAISPISFPLPPLSTVSPHLPSLPSLLCPLPQLSHPFLSFPLHLPLPTPLKSSWRSGERCKLPQQVRAEPGRQTLLVNFQAEICATFFTGMMKNSVIFTVHFTVSKMT